MNPALLTVVCLHVAPGTISVDGLLDDWGLAAPANAGSMKLSCAYDSDELYLAVDMRAESIARSRDRKNDDRLDLRLGGAKITIYPAANGLPHVVEGAPRRTAIVDSLQPHGWSVELGVPLAEVPGWRPHAASIPLVAGAVEARLAFEDADAGYKKFLADLGLTPAQVSLDVSVDLGEGPRRVVVAGKIVGVLDEGYVYLELPAEKPSDVLEVRPVPYAGKRSLLLARWIERGNGGSRELLGLWRVDGARFNRVFAHELAKRAGANLLVDDWKLVAGKKKGSLDLVITAGKVVGWTPDTWHEDEAEDLAPILLPWSPKKQEIWHIDADGVSGG